MPLVSSGESFKDSEQRKDKASTWLWKEVLAVPSRVKWRWRGLYSHPPRWEVRRPEHLGWRGEKWGFSRRSNKQTSDWWKAEPGTITAWSLSGKEEMGGGPGPQGPDHHVSWHGQCEGLSDLPGGNIHPVNNHRLKMELLATEWSSGEKLSLGYPLILM